LCTLLEENNISVKFIRGDVSPDNRISLINDFKNGKYDVLVTNPQTLAESVSLHTICHDAIYFEYGYNLVHLLQSKDRIHRLGLPDNQYTQYYFLRNNYDLNGYKYSLDEQIYNRLLLKEQIMLEAVDSNNLEGFVSSDEDDINAIFEKLKI
jgi:SNF2 family DNA or RNA helicase